MTEWLERVRSELSERYRIDRELGRGSTATVYLADDLAQQRQVAVKVLHPELVQAVGGQRFLREIRVAASLHHPHLLAIHDSGEANGLFYFVAPYLPDGSLRTLLNRERQLSVDEALRITREIADALGYVHEHGIVHRDVKPENILFAGKHACVADFGIARAIEIVVGDTLTSTGLVVGTPAYMSPEQASGERAVDARSDQYSLACVLYEMLAGIPPFVGATAQSVISQRFAHAPSPLTFYRPHVPPGIDSAVARALEIAPADRFESVRDFMAALDRRAPPAVRIDPAVRLRTLRRRWFLAGASAAVAALALFGFSQAYDRVVASRRAALDSSHFVVIPFADSAGGTTLSGAGAAEAVHAALSQWRDLELVPIVAVQDRVGERGTRIGSLEEALDVAADLGAGRLIWGRVIAREGGPSVRLALYDVASRRTRHDFGFVPLTGDTAERVIASMANRMLRGPYFTAGAESGELGTRLLSARRAYERGHTAFERGDFRAAFREFSTAAGLDDAYAHAHFWAAVTGFVVDGDADWRDAARRAMSAGSILGGRDSTLAAAISAVADRRYVAACRNFDTFRRMDSLAFVGWYGLGECRYLDSAVVPSVRSRSGWAFRSSYHTAIAGYLRAVHLDSRVYNSPVYDRLRGTMKAQKGMLRLGQHIAGGERFFSAFPMISAETLAFIAYPIVGGGVTGPEPKTSEAVERNARVMLEFARRWAAHQPRSPGALEAVAAALEVRGELSDLVGGRASALAAVRSARALAVTPLFGLSLGAREVRLLLKAGRFRAARVLADSLLASWPEPTTQAAEILQGLAALTGRVRAVAQLIALAAPEMHVPGVRLTSAVRESVAALDAYAALGACDALRAARATFDSVADSHIAAENAALIKADLTHRAAMWGVPCNGGQSVLSVRSGGAPLVQAQQAFARGQRGRARAILDSIDLSRQVLKPGEISLDHTYQGSWLRAALGDTAGAIRQLDLALRGLVAQREPLVRRPAEAAALPRAMELRADLAAARGDRISSRYWASRALDLWDGADPELRGFVEELRRLARQ